MPQELTYNGKPISTLTKEELLQALNELNRMYQYELSRNQVLSTNTLSGYKSNGVDYTK